MGSLDEQEAEANAGGSVTALEASEVALADPATWFIIDPTLVDVNPRERLALGTTGTMRNRRSALTATVTWTTTELVPDARLVQHTQGIRLRAHGVGDAFCGHARDAGDRRGLPHPHVVCRSAHGCDVTRDHGARSSCRFARLRVLLETSVEAEG